MRRRLNWIGMGLLAAVVAAVVVFVGRNDDPYEPHGKARKPAAEALPPNPLVVARLFGKPVTASELGTWPRDIFIPVQKLRGDAIPEAIRRFVAANALHATEEDFAAFAKYQAEFIRIANERRKRRLAEIDARLASSSGTDERARLERERESLLLLMNRPPPGPDDPKWREGRAGTIEEHKAYKALYEKFRGDVHLGDSGPYPAGAIARLLREHERAGEIVFLDANLAQAFWNRAERVSDPARPDQIDFTYYWLKPVESRFPGFK